MIILPKQQIYLTNANNRLNSTEGAVRSGKTYGTILRWIEFLGTFPSHNEFMMFGKTQSTLRRNIIRPMQKMLGKQMRYKVGSNEIDLWGHKIFCFGAHDESSGDVIRGLTAAGAYGDEITLTPESFFTMMLSRLSVSGAQFHGSTNPDNPYHWYKTNYIDRAAELGMYNLHFNIEDNTTLDPLYVAALKKEYTGLWYRRFILGEWCAAEGAIYDFFDESIHTLDDEDIPKADYYVVGVDYGTGNPTVFQLMGCNSTRQALKLKIWTEQEYYYDSKAKK
jgi:PBSX family phage terminase large subunit